MSVCLAFIGSVGTLARLRGGRFVLEERFAVPSATVVSSFA